MRHCVDRNISSSAPANLSPSVRNRRAVIPIKGYDDEEYARGCLQYYNEQFMVGKEKMQRTAKRCADLVEQLPGRVGEDTFEMYRRYRYRYTRGCIFCIFQILRYRYH